VLWLTVRIEPYRRVLALPGVRALLPVMFLARIPATATSMVLTLHVVLTLHHGYGAAGFVGAVATIGLALGSPLMGRLVDTLGLRPMLVITTIGEAAFWVSARTLPYPGLLATALFGGVLAMPAMSVGRQALAALVPLEQRRTAYSLDSISVEITYMAGPALAVLLATQVSTSAGMIALGGAVVLAGSTLYVVNPPMRAEHEAAELSPPRRTWLGPAMFGTFVTGTGALVVLVGTEVTVVAALRGVGQVEWTGAVTIVICVASATGGIVYGGMRRSVTPAALAALMGLLLVPVGLAAAAPWWLLALILVPTNLLCAPTLTAINDTIARIAPAAARGEAIGWGASAFTLGAAAGGPLIGVVVDRAGAGWGFAAAGIGGVVLAAVASALSRAGSPASPPGTVARVGADSEADAD